MDKFLDILPVIIMVESFLAAIPLFYYGRHGSACYWLSAGMLNLAVIFLIKRFG